MVYESRLTWSRCKGTADTRLADVERYIKSGDGFNWIPDEISSAIHWAIQGYLNHKEITPTNGSDWHSLTLQFCENSSQSLASEASYLLSTASRLEFEMFEIDYDEWMSEAKGLLSRTKELIKAIQIELFSSDNDSI